MSKVDANLAQAWQRFSEDVLSQDFKNRCFILKATFFSGAAAALGIARHADPERACALVNEVERYVADLDRKLEPQHN